jgi:hypothetical protein
VSSDTHLLFEAPKQPGSPTNLVFGDSTGYTLPAAQVSVALLIDSGVSVAAFVVHPVQVSATLAVGGVTLAASCFYDNRVTPYLDCRVMGPLATGFPHARSMDTVWRISVANRAAPETPWGQAVATQRDVASVHAPSVTVQLDTAALQQLTEHRSAQSATLSSTGIFHALSRSGRWADADIRTITRHTSVQAGVANLTHLVAAHKMGSMRLSALHAASGASLRYSGIGALTAAHQTGIQARPGVHAQVPIAVPPATWWWGSNLLFECPPIAGSPARLLFGAQACYPVEVPSGAVIIPVRRIYMVINSASLRRVDGNIALPVFNMSLSIDADSWAWSFSASLPGSVLSDLEPASSGAPVEVEALVNGVPYRALVERVGREREFGKSNIRVSGRGKTALLDSPYAPVQSFSNTSARTAQQLMGDVLSVNGVPLDWSVNFGLEDWLVPAGVFAQQGSYIAALNAIANAAGGYIQPHPSLQIINVLPRYPVAPWEWGAVVPDIELPSDVTTRESIEWLEKARYNRVFVSGQQSGVLGQVTRAGTAGDLLAPMITDALITSAVPARQRGMTVLADTGRQAEVTLRLPVLAETGIITPGKFVKYTDGGASRVGIVRSTGVEIGMPEIWQTLGVQTYA